MDNRAIGIFDSGLGGLTAVKTLKAMMPNEKIIYFGDTGRMPYGGRSPDELHIMAGQDIAFLRSFGTKLILAACGTVSTVVLPTYVQDVNLPVFGVIEPSVEAAASATKNGRIGIIATQASIDGGVMERRLTEINPDLQVFPAACPTLVPLIESGRFEPGDGLLERELTGYLAPLKAQNIDTLLLGCTHYPIISEAISGFMGSGVRLISSSDEAAKALCRYMEANGVASGGTGSGECRYYTSGEAETFLNTAELILGEKLPGSVLQVQKFSLTQP